MINFLKIAFPYKKTFCYLKIYLCLDFPLNITLSLKSLAHNFATRKNTKKYLDYE